MTDLRDLALFPYAFGGYAVALGVAALLLARHVREDVGAGFWWQRNAAARLLFDEALYDTPRGQRLQRRTQRLVFAGLGVVICVLLIDAVRFAR